ncbi:MAG: L,D-transpeptidase family protein [Desulfomonilaceae bacterium]
MKRRRRILLAGTIAVVVLAVVASFEPVRSTLGYLWGKARGGYLVSERLEQLGHCVKKRLKPSFEGAGVKYPPTDLAFVAFKDSRILELYARGKEQTWQFIKAYTVLAASGELGPKLEEGDLQVPEGVYRLESLNPNSRYHLSVRLNYPNDFDRRMAKVDGRTRLGSDIMIHGRSGSIGCLAIGDEAAEDLFVLSALVERERVKVVISPTDFRVGTAVNPIEKPSWVRELYGMLREELGQFQKGT